MTVRGLLPPLDADLLDALLAGVRPVELSAAQRGALRQRIRAHLRAPAPPGMLTLRARDGEWQAVAPGVTRKLLRIDAPARRASYLIRMAPGSAAPHHSHAQVEECLVLDGEVWVGEQRLAAGDWHVALPGSTHADFRSRAGCLLFIASEWHA